LAKPRQLLRSLNVKENVKSHLTMFLSIVGAFVLVPCMILAVIAYLENRSEEIAPLSNMQKLPLNAIKIHRSFVRQITTVPGGTATVGAFIDMGRSLNLRVIAQGVETAEDPEFLWEHDCDEAQGNFFSRPVPPDQLAKLFRPD
jgi:predicted signal transduction protein with EAL and GGDEF domain